ncbi:hypothetical protein [Marinococcus halophilus]|nr:hypothetical protein [Marinococcus halophilus]
MKHASAMITGKTSLNSLRTSNKKQCRSGKGEALLFLLARIIVY